MVVVSNTPSSTSWVTTSGWASAIGFPNCMMERREERRGIREGGDEREERREKDRRDQGMDEEK